ncbi:MAG: HEAT repeat domain-containing protein [Planctomycetota bacterium]|nr:HEAT repeat domain-containing protein [Planctomycetota bacterium]
MSTEIPDRSQTPPTREVERSLPPQPDAGQKALAPAIWGRIRQNVLDLELQGEDGLAELCSLLKNHSDTRVRCLAARSLRNIKNTRARIALSQAARFDSDFQVRSFAIEALGTRSDSTSNLLQLLSEHPDERCRLLSASALNTDRPDVLPSILLERLLHEPSGAVLPVICEALTRHADNETCRMLKTQLSVAEWPRRRYVIAILGELGDRNSAEGLLHRLKAPVNGPEKHLLLDALGKCDHPSIYPVLKANFHSHPQDPVIVSTTLRGLARHPASSGRTFVMNIASGTDQLESTRRYALEALASTGDPELEFFFREVLATNPSRDIQESAQRFLDSLSDSR